MSFFGLPPSMFFVFVATIVAGSLGAIHYVVVHVILGRDFGEDPIRRPHPSETGGKDD